MTKVIICFFVKINLVQKKKRSNNIKKTHFKKPITMTITMKNLKIRKLTLSQKFSLLFIISCIIYYSDMCIDSNIVNCMEPEADQIVVDTINSVDRAGLPLILGITIVAAIIIWIFGIK